MTTHGAPTHSHSDGPNGSPWQPPPTLLHAHGRRASPQGPVELPSRRANRRGKRIDPEPALQPERAGSDGRPGAPAWPRQHVRFAAVAPASRALSIERPRVAPYLLNGLAGEQRRCLTVA